MRTTFHILLLAILGLGLSISPSPADAACSQSQIKKLKQKGMSKQEILEFCQEGKAYEEEEDAEDEPTSRGAKYCCDIYGRKWCAIRVNPGPPGSPCWCAGVPGTGIMCD